MTNGKLEEPIKKEATLEDVEPAVFEQLVKYAYKGLYGIANGMIGQRVTMQQNSPGPYRCHACGGSWKGNKSQYPFCAAACKNSFDAKLNDYLCGFDGHMVHCVIRQCTSSMAMRTYGRVLCLSHSTAGNRSHYPQIDSKPNVTDDNDKTTNSLLHARKYGCSTHTHEELSEHIDRHITTANQSLGLLQHAKLYVLATKHMTKDLSEICLHKLHRNLVNFTIEDEHIDEMIDLVLYIYTNTSNGGNILDGTADKLRDLVMAYVAWKQKELTKYEAFKQMLAAAGAQTADYIALICA